MEPMVVIAAITAGITGIEKVTKIYKDWTATLPPGPKKDEAECALGAVTADYALAKVEIAKGFGYPLCRRHLIPGVMLDIREDFNAKWKCSTCGDITPKPTPEITVDSSFGF